LGSGRVAAGCVGGRVLLVLVQVRLVSFSLITIRPCSQGGVLPRSMCAKCACIRVISSRSSPGLSCVAACGSVAGVWGYVVVPPVGPFWQLEGVGSCSWVWGQEYVSLPGDNGWWSLSANMGGSSSSSCGGGFVRSWENSRSFQDSNSDGVVVITKGFRDSHLNFWKSGGWVRSCGRVSVCNFMSKVFPLR
jgi:hypothetical protein